MLFAKIKSQNGDQSCFIAKFSILNNRGSVKRKEFYLGSN